MDTLTLTWIGGEHEFALPIGPLRALQDATDAGPEQLFNKMRLATWRIDDALHILRCGLIGGGMDKATAAQLINSLVELHPHRIAEFKVPAIAIMQFMMFGPSDDPVGKPEGVPETPPENGNSPPSTRPVQ